MFDFAYQSNEAMEVKVKKLSETYASGNLNLRKLTDSLKIKASSDLEQVTSMISSQTAAVENVCNTWIYLWSLMPYLP